MNISLLSLSINRKKMNSPLKENCQSQSNHAAPGLRIILSPFYVSVDYSGQKPVEGYRNQPAQLCLIPLCKSDDHGPSGALLYSVALCCARSRPGSLGRIHRQSNSLNNGKRSRVFNAGGPPVLRGTALHSSMTRIVSHPANCKIGVVNPLPFQFRETLLKSFN